MRKFAAVALLACCAPALADTPLQSVDAFEADARRCLLQGKRSADCLGGVIGGHFSPRNEKLNEVVPQLTAVFTKWVGEDHVFAVHRVRQRKIGELYEERTFIVEDARGNLIMLDLAFMARLGKWYVHRFNISTKVDEFSEALGVKL